MSDWSRFDLSAQEIKKKIEELNRMRSRRRKWLAGASLCALGITIACLLVVRNAALGLLEDGPTHDEFVSELTRQITKQMLPQANDFGVQASYGQLPLPEAVAPTDRDLTALAKIETSDPSSLPSKIKESSSQMDGQNPSIGICSAVDDPQKPLGHFREQTVAEYQATVTKIVSDLAAIRGREGKDNAAGLSAGAVASLFVSHVQEGLPKPAPENYYRPADSNASKDTR